MTTRFVRSLVAAATLAAALAGPARAHGNPSDASALSMLPIAVSVAAPAMLISGGAVLTVIGLAIAVIVVKEPLQWTRALAAVVILGGLVLGRQRRLARGAGRRTRCQQRCGSGRPVRCG